MDRIKKSTLIFLLLFSSLTGWGEDFKVKQYTSDDGLPDNSIRTILQDSQGFIWLGMVGSGLVRYDGHNFLSILENDRINTLSEDEAGHLWISSMKGEPLCYDLKTETFVDFTPEGTCPRYKLINHIGDMTWLWDRNLGCTVVSGNGTELKSQRLDSYNSTLPDNRVNYILGGTGGRVWIGTRKGLAYFRDGNSTIVDATLDFISGTIIGGIDYHITRDGQVYTLAQDGLSLEYAASLDLGDDAISAVAGTGRQWLIQSRNSGAFLFDTDNLVFIPAPKEWNIPRGRVENDRQGNSYITNGSGNILFFDRSGGGIHKIIVPGDGENTHSERFRYHRTSEGTLWITERTSGLYRYDIEKNELSRIDFNNNSRNNPNNVLLYTIEDREGNLWSASEFYGIFKLVPVSRGVSFINFGKNIDANRICMVSTASNREVWVSSEERKLYSFSADLKQLKSELTVPALTNGLVKLSDGRFAFSTMGEGLVVGWDRYNADNSPIGNYIYCGLEDSKSRIWVGTLSSGLAVGIKDKNGKYSFRSFADNDDQRYSVKSLCLDGRGNIWAGTEQNGAVYFNPDELLGLGDDYQTAIHKVNLASDNISNIFLDSRNNLWLAELGSGFCIVSGDVSGNYKITHYGMENGLMSSMVNGFTEGADGSIWISTSNGLSRMDPQSGTITNHTLSSEVLRNLCNTGAIRTLRDGRIAVGTGGGLAIVDPEEIAARQPREGKLRLTEFRLGGVKVGPGDADYPAELAVGYLDGITLPFKQNNFTICFSSMDYAQNVSYDFKLEGYDNDWSHSASDGSATYRNVRPGKYTFLVHISGREEEEGNRISFNIKIKYPPLASPAAFVIYLLLFLAGISAIFLIFHRISKLKARAEMEKSLSEYKATFFTNVSHEFRTPLTLIVSSLDDIRAKYSDSIANDRSFKVMEKGAGRLRTLVEQLLEIKKFNEEKQILHLEKADIVLFIRDIYNTFLDSAAGRKTRFSFESGKNAFIMPFDKSAMDKIAFNLISNALKYTPEGGSINISLSFTDKFCFRVTDTGIGVAENLREHLFDRFVKGDSGADSVGLGLSLTKALVENHKGSISYEPNPGGGSIFTVTLPLDINAYSEEDFIIQSAIIEDDDIEFNFEKPLNPQTILVIEEDSDIRNIMVEALGEYFNVLSASDGEKGLAILEEGTPVELIVSDIMMPGISGFEVTEKVKSDFATCHIPVILLTSLSGNEDRYEGARRGADAFITKPFSKKYILMKIIKLLEQRSKLREKYSSDLSLRPDVLCNNKIDRDFLDKIESIMEKHLGDTMFSMDAFAEELNMGRTAFYSKVSSVTGYSPNNYIKIFRMKKAAELISTGRFTAAEIAYKVGIKDASYFTKLFKEQFGMTPKEYLKQAREKGPEAQ